MKNIYAFITALLFLSVSAWAEIAVTDVTNATDGECNGAIEITANGSAGPYNITLTLDNNPAGEALFVDGTHTFDNLCAGVYTIEVVDAYGCKKTFEEEIHDCPEIELTDPQIHHPTGCNENDGSLYFRFGGPSGGTWPYSYEWNTGQTDLSIYYLGPGTYTVTVTDGNGCTGEFSYELIGGEAEVQLWMWADHTCEGVSNGTAESIAYVEGGSNDFEYEWSNGADTESIYNVPAGTYCLTVTEINTDCTATDCVEVEAIPSNGPFAITATVQHSCSSGYSTGQIYTQITGGGTPPYDYEWEGPHPWLFGANAYYVPAGTYCVTVTDLCDNANSACFTVEEYSVDVSANVTNTCPGVSLGSIQASGNSGTAPYSFEWSTGSNSSQISNLSQGTYCVTVTDNRACSATECFTVGTDPLVPTLADLQGFTVLINGAPFLSPTVCVENLFCHGQFVGQATHELQIIGANNFDGTCMINITCNETPLVIGGTGQIFNVLQNGNCVELCVFTTNSSQFIPGTSVPLAFITEVGQFSPQQTFQCMIGGIGQPSRFCRVTTSCNGEVLSITDESCTVCENNGVVCCGPFAPEDDDNTAALLPQNDDAKSQFVIYNEVVSVLSMHEADHMERDDEMYALPSTATSSIIPSPQGTTAAIRPNPFTGSVTLELAEVDPKEIYRISVTNNTQQKVLEAVLEGTEYGRKIFKIDMSQTPPGVYYLLVRDSRGHMSTHRLIHIR